MKPMKTKIFLTTYISAILLLLLFSCEKDNFSAPESMLSGKITYNDESIGVRSNALQLELWQHGYQNFTKIPVHIDQDGTFSAMLFDGNYKLVRMNGAPWENNTDSIDVVVKGNTVVDVPVVPYFTISNAAYSRNAKQITATFTVNRVSNQRELRAVRLFLGRTIITDNGYNIASAEKPASEVTLGTAVTLTVTIPDSHTEKFLYARIGVETEGIGQLLYSPSEKIQLD